MTLKGREGEEKGEGMLRAKDEVQLVYAFT